MFVVIDRNLACLLGRNSRQMDMAGVLGTCVNGVAVEHGCG